MMPPASIASLHMAVAWLSIEGALGLVLVGTIVMIFHLPRLGTVIALVGVLIVTVVMVRAEGAVTARAGEWVTRDTDNSKVCQLSRDLFAGDAPTPGLCDPDTWTEPRPQFGQSLDGPIRHWIKCDGSGCLVHFDNGWRP